MNIEKNELLSRRLLKVYSLIPSCETVVDVGSDHGKLGAFCLMTEKCRNLIATDIHEQPAQRTRLFLEGAGFGQKAQVLHTDGLKGVDLSKDATVVIAGMGGLEMIKILSSAKDEGKIFPGMYMVLQPQRSFEVLRAYLCESGFSIEEEAIELEKGHFYVAMRVMYKGKPYALSDAQLFLGPYILEKKPDLFSEYMEHEKKLLEKRALGDPRCREILLNWEKWI